MKRYLLFIGKDYYSFGGMNDFKKDSDSVKELDKIVQVASLEDFNPDNELPLHDTEQECIDYFWEANWAHIYDTKERKIIKNYPE